MLMESSTFLGPTTFSPFSTVLGTYCIDGNVNVYAAWENEEFTISTYYHMIYITSL